MRKKKIDFKILVKFITRCNPKNKLFSVNKKFICIYWICLDLKFKLFFYFLSNISKWGIFIFVWLHMVRILIFYNLFSINLFQIIISSLYNLFSCLNLLKCLSENVIYLFKKMMNFISANHHSFKTNQSKFKKIHLSTHLLKSTKIQTPIKTFLIST